MYGRASGFPGEARARACGRPAQAAVVASGPVEVRDYNGEGRWSRAGILERYRASCRDLRVAPALDLAPRETTEGEVRWVYPVMERVIEGIEAGDPACIALGLDFIHEDGHFPFGKVLKSNTARALRRARLTQGQVERVRRRVLGMLLVGHVPREFKEYAKLLRKVGLGEAWPEVEARADRSDPQVLRWLAYFREAGPAGGAWRG